MESDIPEICSVDEYDSEKAKFQASILWLLTKAYNGNIPNEYKQLFYEDVEGSWFIKPQLKNKLNSAELYCVACANIFQESPAKWQDGMSGSEISDCHSAVIQTLSRKGIYILENNETAVTETVLMQTSPFRIAAHLATMDAIMKAYVSLVVSVEKVVQSVRRFTTVAASSELPYDLEDALLFWLNKSCSTVRQRLEREEKVSRQKEISSGQQTLAASKVPCIPTMDDLLKDVGDGCCLATLVSFYCPNCLKLEDICLKPNVAIADSLYNIQVIKKFCSDQLPRCIFHLTYNDIMYTSNLLKPNMITLLAELFDMFEVNRVSCVTGPMMQKVASPKMEQEATTATTIAKIPPISEATKKSFHWQSEQRTTSSLDHPCASASNPKQHLLPKRAVQNTHSIHGDSEGNAFVRPHALGKQSGEPTARAWEVNPNKKPDTKPSAADSKHRTYTKSSLRKLSPDSDISSSKVGSQGSMLTNVSLDSELMESVSESRIGLSFSDFDSPRDVHLVCQPPVNSVDPSDPDYLVVQSAISQASSACLDVSQRPSGFSEPLMPAKLKKAKEKNNSNHPKDVESGEKMITSPSSPARAKSIGKTNGSPKRLAQLRQESESSSEDEFMTPQTSQPSTPFGGSPERRSPDKVVPPTQTEHQNAAYFVDTENSVQRPVRSAKDLGKESETSAARRCTPVARSFTKVDRPATSEQARQAGIPIISDTESVQSPIISSQIRRDSGSQSSSDFSDHESSKIHRDHKIKESSDSENSFYLPPRDSGASTRPDSLFSTKASDANQKTLAEVQVNDSTKSSPTTSFAEIKRNSGSLGQEISTDGVVYNAGLATAEVPKISLKSQFHKTKEADSNPKPAKKTTFAALPNQTTWQESAQKTAQMTKDMNKENEMEAGQPVASEISNVRLKLEAKRRNIEIEKKRLEAQWNKQRQRLGKAAFFHVVGKGKNDKSIESIEEEKEDQRSPTPKHAEDKVVQKPPPAKLEKKESVVKTAVKNVPTVEMPRERSPAKRESPQPRSMGKEPSPAKSKKVSLSETAAGDRCHKDSNRSTPPPKVEPIAAEKEPSNYTTEEIKQTIENVKQRWFPDESSNQSARDQSNSFQTSAAGDDYGNSLEKLNMSLNDLQGEIMKLTLQQEQITKTISTSGSPKSSPRPSIDIQHPTTEATPRVPQGHSQDTYYSQSGPGTIPDPYSVQGRTFPHQSPYVAHHPYSSQEYPGIPNQYGMPPGPPYPPVNTSQSGFLQYHHGIPQMQQYQQHPMYPHLYSQHQAIRPPGQYMPGQSPFITQPQTTLPHSYLQNVSSPSSQYGHQNVHVPGYHQPPVMSTHTITSNSTLPGSQLGQSYQPQSSYNATSNSLLHQDTSPVLTQSNISSTQSEYQESYQPAVDAHSLQMSSSYISNASGSYHSTASDQNISSCPLTPSASLPTHSSEERLESYEDHNVDETSYTQQHQDDQHSPRTEQPQIQTEEKNEPEPVELPEDMAVEQYGNNNGFYITFGDAETPKKSKPKLHSQRHQLDDQDTETDHLPQPVPSDISVAKESSHAPRTREDMLKASYTLPIDTPKRIPQPEVEEEVRPSPPGVGFVVSESHVAVAEEDEAMMQKRKERLMQIQMRRKMEQDKKKAKLEMEMAKKREEQRLKEELLEHKKAEEKARREQIFQAYKARKAAEEEEEAGGSPAAPSAKPKAKSKPGSSPAIVPHMYSKDDTQSNAGNLTHRRGNSPGGSGTRLYRSQSAFVLSKAKHRNESRKGSCRGNNHSDASDTGSNVSLEYTGPKLFVKPKSMSNRSVIQNALAHCCLAGSVNNELKDKVLEQLELCDANHFLILFRDAGCKFRGLYQYNPDTEEVYKVMGTGPRQITPKMFDRFYKYNSGSKSFSQITSTKHLSVSIDAITIQSSLWQTKKPTGSAAGPSARRPPPPNNR